MPPKKRPRIGRKTAGAAKSQIYRQSQSQEHTNQRLARMQESQAAARASETPEQHAIRLLHQRRRQAATRAAESPDQCEVRLRHQQESQAAARASETPEQHAIRLLHKRRRQATIRAAESPDQREVRLLHQRRRQTATRAAESPDQCEVRLRHQQESQAAARASETPEQHAIRLLHKGRRQATIRAAESPDQREVRLRHQQESQAAARASETPEQRAIRQLHHQTRQAATRLAESPDRRATRQSREAQRARGNRAVETEEQRIRRLENNLHHAAHVNRQNRPSKAEWSLKAFHYDPQINYTSHEQIVIGNMNRACVHCGALKWPRERPAMCCFNGKVRLPELKFVPEWLKKLLIGNDFQHSAEFLENIRSYNSAFQMTSFGHHRVRERGYMPTFKIQGQVYHQIGSLLPTADNEAQFLQVYFMGNHLEQATRRSNIIPGTKIEILGPLQEMLHFVNPYVRQFKTAYQRRNELSVDHKIIIRGDRTPVGEHVRCFNEPTNNEVAVLIAAPEQATRRDIVLEWQDGRRKSINELNPAYDALQYPLLFPHGEDGYTIDIPQVDPDTGHPMVDPITGLTQPYKKVTQQEFYSYRFMVRPGQEDVIHRGRTLTNQYAVDLFAKIDSERLLWYITHQREVRAAEYNHLRDEVNRNDYTVATDIGRDIKILPAKHIGGRRYFHGKSQDALTYVRVYGRPDLFITLTCNPSWQEIKDHLLSEPYLESSQKQKQEHRQDITARVFKLKLEKLMDLLILGQLFGPLNCHLYTVEWQKRGLPHAHILLWLKEKIRPTDIDLIISAEFPDKREDPILYNIIKNNMVHGPCGYLNKNSVCMEKEKCTKKYPKQYVSETKSDIDGYPLYRRRSPEDGGATARVKIRGTAEEIEIDNRWVVPHNRMLCKIFNTHINVEYCNSVKAIKYVCKYCNKGPDRAVYQVENQRNEIAEYKTGRYISTNEAFWRIFGFEIHAHYPAVFALAIHLENGQRVIFNQQNIQAVAAEPPKSTLTAFFELCQKDNFATTLLYPEVPTYFVWKNKTWQRRAKGKRVENYRTVFKSVTLSRVYMIHPLNSECYHLRMLLHIIRGPTSFEQLKIVDGVLCPTYKEACLKRGLLESDDHFHRALEETTDRSSPMMLRQLFATIIAHCNVADVLSLWNTHKYNMCSDILQEAQVAADNDQMIPNDNIYNTGLIYIEDAILARGGQRIKSYNLPEPRRENNEGYNRFLLRETNYNLEDLHKFVTEREKHLNPDQRAAYTFIINRIKSNEGGVIFLDAPGGTGKTFLLNLLLAKIRGNREIAVAVASSGIAATLLTGGRTAHSALKLPLNLREQDNPRCNMDIQCDQAAVLKQCKIIVWDEATMAHKNALLAVDKTMQDFRKIKSTMGGAILLLAGDFRQTLPIIPKGTPADEIDACLKSSYLWRNVISLSLKTNMRARLQNEEGVGDFSKTLLNIGNGAIETDDTGYIDVSNIGQCVKDTEELCERVYPNLNERYTDINWLCERAVLAPTNQDVNTLNTYLLSKIVGEEKCYTSVDSVTDPEQVTMFPPEFLNTQDPPGMPSHKLHLKKGCSVILLRNLNAPILCNGTRLKIENMYANVIEGIIMTGQGKGQNTYIPRMPLEPSDCPYPMRRLQFPLRLSFAMTINKSQGQSLQVVGLNLKNSCFSHGQLYVGCSRVGHPMNLFIYAPDKRTKNVVHSAALQ